MLLPISVPESYREPGAYMRIISRIPHFFALSFVSSCHKRQSRNLMPSQTSSRSCYARSRIVAVALLALLFSAASCHATCYFPDGSTATSMVTCPDSKSCCGKNQACLSNGLCFGADLGVIYRGSCSDKSWPIADCPRACYTGTLSLKCLHPL